MELPILLIGPHSAGKSAVGKLLALQLKLPFLNLWEVCEKYWQEIGYDETLLDLAWENDQADGVYRYWKQFDLHAVARLLKEHQNCVIDFGAGHSIYEDDGDFARARELLAPYTNVVLLMPSPDLDESVAVLRRQNTPIINGMEANRFFATHPSNRKLATLVVYTKGQTPSETRDEILKHLELTHRQN